MAHGLETRVPFLDNDLADFAMRLPAHAKLGNLTEVIRIDENEPGGKGERYFRKPATANCLLRKMMSRYIPETNYRASEAGLLRARRELVQGRKHRLRATFSI